MIKNTKPHCFIYKLKQRIFKDRINDSWGKEFILTKNKFKNQGQDIAEIN